MAEEKEFRPARKAAFGSLTMISHGSDFRAEC
jgi:hypothetical protein